MIRTNSNGEAFYFCPNCNKLYKLTGIIEPVPEYDFDCVDETGNTPGYYDADFHIWCKCGSPWENKLVPLDPGIAKQIVILNRKGYKTYFSCEGHSVNQCDFYIAFTVHNNHYDEIMNVAKEILPEDWELKPTQLSGFGNQKDTRGLVLRVFMGNWFNEFGYYDDSETSFWYEDPISNKEYKKKHKRYLKEFKDIVKSLPNISGEDFNERVLMIEYKVKNI